MIRRPRKSPRKYHPHGFDILYEDDDIIVGNKAPGLLTVAAPYEREQTVHHFLNDYVRKGNSKSRRTVFVVHRLDRETSGVLIFARTERAQQVLKDNWKDTQKIYHAIVHGRMARKEGTISSYLVEDDKYRMHSFDEPGDGKLAHTQYRVIRETPRFSLLEITLLTGRKNQIRVHMAGEGHPLVGDDKYGPPQTHHARLALHAQSIEFPHPVTGERLRFEAVVPDRFYTLVGGSAGR